MKKVLALSLSLAMLFCMFGCGKAAEDTTAKDTTPANTIDLGGGIGEYELHGSGFGQYEVIETPEEWLYEGCDVTTYADPDCNVPYITVYRWNKANDTLDTVAQRLADEYAEGYFQTKTDPNLNCETKCVSGHFEYKDDFYYFTSFLLEDDDDFVEFDFCDKTSEVQIGNTGVYAWVPAGYTDGNNQDYIDHGMIFTGMYNDYIFSELSIFGPSEGYSDYEYDSWYWSDLYPDGLPMTEEEYSKTFNNGDYSDNYKAYYKAFGVDVDYASIEEHNDYPYEGAVFALSRDNTNYGMEVLFFVDDELYVAWFKFLEDFAPAFGTPFLDSLHTK